MANGMAHANITNSLTVSQWVDSGACSSGTTCTITATVPAGDLLIFNTYTTSISRPTTVTNCGTYVDLPIMSGDGNSHYGNWGYIATSLSASSCVINYGATTGGARAYLWDITQVGTPALDSINNYFIYDPSGTTGISGCTSSTSCTQAPLTLSGTSCLAVAGNRGFLDTTAVAASWTDTHHQDNTMLADQVNVTSVGTPVWTVGNDPITVGLVSFCFSPTASVNWGLFDSSGGTVSSNPTEAMMNNSTFGLSGNGANNKTQRNSWYWEVGNASTAFTFTTAAHHALLTAGSPPRFLVSGSTYAESTACNAAGCGLDYNTNVTNAHIDLFYPGKDTGAQQTFGSSVQTSCIDFWTDIAANHALWVVTDLFTVNDGASSVINAQLDGTGTTLRLQMEGATGGSPISIGSSTWIKICLQSVASGTQTMTVLDDSGVSLGTNTKANPGATSMITTFFGENGGGTPPTGQHYRFDKLVVCTETGGLTACATTITP